MAVSNKKQSGFIFVSFINTSASQIVIDDKVNDLRTWNDKTKQF